jgi:small subunit ribosomal protein S1
MTVEVHNSEQTESKPLNTELETLAPEATAEQTDLSPETHPTPQVSDDAGNALDSISASSGEHTAPESRAV